MLISMLIVHTTRNHHRRVYIFFYSDNGFVCTSTYIYDRRAPMLKNKRDWYENEIDCDFFGKK